MRGVYAFTTLVFALPQLKQPDQKCCVAMSYLLALASQHTDQLLRLTGLSYPKFLKYFLWET